MKRLFLGRETTSKSPPALDVFHAFKVESTRGKSLYKIKYSKTRQQNKVSVGVAKTCIEIL